MLWYPTYKEAPPSINPTDANGNYRPEYIEWLKGLPVEKWDDIRNCLEAGVCDYAEYEDEDGFIIRLFADEKEHSKGFEYIFAVNTRVLDDKGWTVDMESGDMPTEHWHLVQACAFMWQSDPTEWSLENY